MNNLDLRIDFSPYFSGAVLAVLLQLKPDLFDEFFIIDIHDFYNSIDLEDVFHDTLPYHMARDYILLRFPEKIAKALYGLYSNKMRSFLSELLPDAVFLLCRGMNIPVIIDDRDFQSWVGFNRNENCRQAHVRASKAGMENYQQLIVARNRRLQA